MVMQKKGEKRAEVTRGFLHHTPMKFLTTTVFLRDNLLKSNVFCTVHHCYLSVALLSKMEVLYSL